MEISENLNDKIKKLTNHEKVVTKYYGGINILKNIQKKKRISKDIHCGDRIHTISTLVETTETIKKKNWVQTSE